ncbi:Uncharacterised protein [Candidatus Burarchaeum australiense]|nr:Uncharacterised protein [Candidatus Burarchaeum australiense]
MAVKNRNPIFVVVASFITCFIYAVYWFYRTREELFEITKKQGSALLDTILLFVPLANLWVLWKYCEDADAASGGTRDKVLLFVLSLVFLPAMQYLAQVEINKHAA